ncbi:MAG: D-2-hydroxyacid dehydrogenase [Clostridiales bacterium]|nr:D-2-hydroxyacid dehydrogenase [Clostridiales bacterium]
MLNQLRAVALDAATLGDVRWEGYEQFASFARYDLTGPDQVVERAAGAHVVFTNKVRIGEAEMAALPELKYIGVLATGYDVVDVGAAALRGIAATNVPGYATHAVAQHAFALLLALVSRVAEHSDSVLRDRRWCDSATFSYWLSPVRELYGRTMGIVGVGAIGERVGALAEAFGMRVVGFSPRPKPVTLITDFTWVSFEKLLAVSDVVSLHCPLFPATRGLMNEKAFSQMKKSALLINTSRGGLIDEADLRRALDGGLIAGAGLDVLSTEPPGRDNPLLGAPNLIVTPHMAWAAVEARERLVSVALHNVELFDAGQPDNLVGG